METLLTLSDRFDLTAMSMGYSELSSSCVPYVRENTRLPFTDNFSLLIIPVKPFLYV